MNTTLPPKRNARGETRCAICGVYKAADAFYASRHHRSYCIVCERSYALQVANHRYRTDPEYRERHKAAGCARAKARSREHQASLSERRDIVQNAVTTLRERGLVYREIGELCGVSMAAVELWARGDVIPQEAAEARVLHLLILTHGFPPMTRPRGVYAIQHPQIERLRKAMQPVLAANPLYANAKRKATA